jgi:hypothetical protein
MAPNPHSGKRSSGFGNDRRTTPDDEDAHAASSVHDEVLVERVIERSLSGPLDGREAESTFDPFVCEGAPTGDGERPPSRLDEFSLSFDPPEDTGR